MMNKAIKSYVITMLFQVLLFLLQFVIAPLVYPLAAHASNEQFIVIIVTAALIAIVGIYVFEAKFRYWLLTFPVYFLSVIIYFEKGLYRVEWGFLPSMERFSVIVCSLYVLIIELIVWIVFKISQKILNRKL